MSPETLGLIVSCEHGGHRVPPELAERFSGAQAALAGHRGWDPGALELARRLAARFSAPLFAAETSRLVVDLNRSPASRRLFSEFTAGLPAADRQALVETYHAPYRRAVADAVAERIARRETAVHLSVHTFTPVLDGAVRRADVGLLYDPARPGEKTLCRGWQAALAGAGRVRRNSPYRGVADGLVTRLRRRFGPDRYLGVELEVNQRFPLAGGEPWRVLQDRLGDGLAAALEAVEAPTPRP